MSSSRVSVRPFGTLPDGSPVELYLIRVGVIELSAITLGAIITSVRVPDRDGHLAEVVLGHETLDPYLSSTHVLDHELTILADAYTPVGPELIPTGQIAGVAGTPFDFRVPRVIGAGTQLLDEQQPEAGGFDHNFVLTGGNGQPRTAALLRDPMSGRRLEVATTEPGVQFYSGHKLDGSITGAYGRMLDRHAGLCLETQHFPDTPNQPTFPPVTLEPHQQYFSTTVWRFTAE